MNTPNKYQLFHSNMVQMIESGDAVEKMSTKELGFELCKLDNFHHSSLESWVISESLFRMLHPFTWRLRHLWSKVSAKWSTWNYLRRKP